MNGVKCIGWKMGRKKRRKWSRRKRKISEIYSAMIYIVLYNK